MSESAKIAADGGNVAKHARQEIEARLGETVISSQNAHDFLLPPDATATLPFDANEDIKE